MRTTLPMYFGEKKKINPRRQLLKSKQNKKEINDV